MARLKVGLYNVVLVAGVLSIAACTAAPSSLPEPSPPAPLTVCCATAAVPTLRALVEQFKARWPLLTIRLQIGNSAWCAGRARQGEALGVVVAVPPTGMWSAPLAVDGIAFVVHRDNSLAGLTLPQLRDVLSGRVWHWSELGATGVPDEITVVVREEGSGTRVALEEAATADGQRIVAVDVTSTAVVVPGSREVAGYVAAHRGAIGYLAGGYLYDARGIKALRIEGELPVPDRAAGGRYPFSLPLFFVAPREPTGVARRLVDFALSVEGQSIVAERLYPLRLPARR